MAPLTDLELRRRYLQPLEYRRYRGYVTWKQTAREWVETKLAGTTTRQIDDLMWEHVAAGGEIDQQRERRPEWSEQYHYDLRIRIRTRRVYIETVLLDDDPDDPTIHVVSIHDA